MNFGAWRIAWGLILAAVCTPRGQTDVSFMTFNLWHDGTSVTNGLDKIRDVIAAANPDVIGFTEVSEATTLKIQDALAAIGRNYSRGYVESDVSILSKYPITSSGMVESRVARFGIKVNGNSLTALIAHLDYTWYACYLPRGYNGSNPDWNMIDDGNGNPAPVTDVNRILAYNLTAGRDESIKAVLNYAAARTEPVVLLGDFNEPSHRDWTSRTKDLFDHHGTVIPWNSSTSLEGGKFVDAFREVYPDEVRNPGFTWPSFADGKGSTSWTPKADERDRIDFVFYKGTGVTARSAALVGPRRSYALNALTTANTTDEKFIADSLPWPSDHKALFATLRFPFSSTALFQKVRKAGFDGTSDWYAPNGALLHSDLARKTHPKFRYPTAVSGRP